MELAFPTDLGDVRVEEVLVPLDLSPTSARVLPWAVVLARVLGARLVLFHVALPARALLLLAPEVGDPEERRRELLRNAHTSLQELTEKIRGLDVDAQYEMWERPEVEALLREQREALIAWVGDRIVERAARAEVGLVVLASHGQGGRPDLALGSVAYYVLKRSPKPLLVVPVLI